jgi:inosine/xanthosine triphosphatase
MGGMKIIVGSTNPIKIDAARQIFARMDSAAQIDGVEVDSGVSHQPWGDEETRTGAVNRASAAMRKGADYGVGFEGGVINTEHGLMTCAWCAVVDAGGRVGIGGGVNVQLPPQVAKALHNGEELGPAMDALTGDHNTKQGPGAAGILTDGLTNRQSAYEHVLALALATFRRPDLYQ